MATFNISVPVLNPQNNTICIARVSVKENQDTVLLTDSWRESTSMVKRTREYTVLDGVIICDEHTTIIDGNDVAQPTETISYQTSKLSDQPNWFIPEWITD